jgi:GntR family transcriptional regulator
VGQDIGIPKYLRISRDIIRMIRRGKLTLGSVAPSEMDIIVKYRVSNTTARKALQELAGAGWVKRVKGRGTYVTSRRVGRSIDRILGFNKNMIEAGRQPSTKVLGVRVSKIARSLALNGRRYHLPAPLCLIKRLRLADGVPMMKETRFISVQLCPGIEKKNLAQSLYDIYERDYGLELSEVCQTLSAVTLNAKEDLDLFEVEDPIPAFRVEGLTFGGKEMILEMEESLYRGDQYNFTVRATRGRMQE